MKLRNILRDIRSENYNLFKKIESYIICKNCGYPKSKHSKSFTHVCKWETQDYESFCFKPEMIDK